MMKHGLRAMLSLLLCSVAIGCTGTPDGVRAVEALDLDRYLGTWYEIARLDHPFERGLRDVTARYARRPDGGLSVVNRGFDAEEGAWRQAEGRAYAVSGGSPGELEVSFFGPFFGGYNVIALDPDDYGWSLVAGPSRKYLWILARTPRLEAEVLGDLVARARALGFPTDDLIYVEHGAMEDDAAVR